MISNLGQQAINRKWINIKCPLEAKNPQPEGAPSKYLDTEEIEYRRYGKH
jgi:hypothetical protein